MSVNPKKLALLNALENSLGIVTSACREVGLSRETHYRWIKEDDEYAKAVSDLKNVSLDFAEAKLFRLMKAENTSAIIFYLKTQGKNRGYVERQEVAGVAESPLSFKWTEGDD